MNKRSGFTIIEILIYSAIVATFIVSVMLALWTMLDASTGIMARSEIIDNNRFVYQKLAWAIKGASDISTPAVGGNGQILTLTRNISGVPTTLTFSLQNSVLKMRRGLGPTVPLTNNWVKVASLGFETYSFDVESKKTVRVKMTLVSGDPRYPLATTPSTASSSFSYFLTIR